MILHFVCTDGDEDAFRIFWSSPKKVKRLLDIPDFSFLMAGYCYHERDQERHVVLQDLLIYASYEVIKIIVSHHKFDFKLMNSYQV